MKKTKTKIWKRIVLGFIIGAVWATFSSSFTFDKTIELKSGQSAQTFFNELSWNHKFQVKWYIKTHKTDLSSIEWGEYVFSGSYTPASFVAAIIAGPQTSYARITVLEWWSIYDIDQSLTDKGLIKAGEYIAFVTDPSIIAKYQTRYEFLKTLTSPNTLEWFLYPDTYNVDKQKNILDQLVYLQLDTFNKKVWGSAQQLLSTQKLNWYQVITMASIVEKEERNNANKATVAGILLKRFQIGTLIGADISLCYSFKQPYKVCTPSFIGQHVSEDTNPYNTRRVRWLPPTPIANPSLGSILAVLQPEQTPYFFYLHDNKWVIHYATTLDEHNQNKKFYIQ